MKIVLHEGDVHTFLIVAASGRSILAQSDWEFPGLATTFGWTPCPCGTTDGTIDCEHRTVGDMIADAQDFLRAHAGDTVDDPGYF
jgi:hypothetical protein